MNNNSVPSSDAIAVHDELDPTAAPPEIREMASRIAFEKAGQMQSATSILKGLKIGIPQVCFLARCAWFCSNLFILFGRNISLQNCRLKS
jgi:hypothetical protein